MKTTPADRARWREFVSLIDPNGIDGRIDQALGSALADIDELLGVIAEVHNKGCDTPACPCPYCDQHRQSKDGK